VIFADGEYLTLKSMNYVASECAQWSAAILSGSNRKFLAVYFDQLRRLMGIGTPKPHAGASPMTTVVLSLRSIFRGVRCPYVRCRYPYY